MGIRDRIRFRRAPRHPADWFGKYRLDEGSDPLWHPCRVIDVSLGGSRLELLGPPATVGDRLLVELQVAEPEVAPHPLYAHVRHVGRGHEGGVFAGVEFAELDDLARSLLELLIEAQSAYGESPAPHKRQPRRHHQH
jgi:hypothetical protein